MKNRMTIIHIFCILLSFTAFAFAGDLQYPEVVLTPQDRILIMAPHPDDEVLGCGGIIQRAAAKGLPIRIVFFTYGDNNEWAFVLYRRHLVFKPKAVQRMGLIRHDEALAADKVLGVPPENITFLGYPDFGTLNIFHYHWGDNPPFKSMLTKVKAVPYQNALRPGAPYKGEEVLKDIEFVLRDFKPTKIFLSHPADHNRDHLALYLFTRVAVWDLEKEIKPELYPYLVHFGNWPKPKGLFPDKRLEPPSFLSNIIAWENFNLVSDETKRKEIALQAHLSQFESSKKYLSSFIRINELFGDFGNILLITNTPPVSLLELGREDLFVTPEKLLNKDQTFYLGTEQEYIQLKDSKLEFSIKFSKPIVKKTNVIIYIFGYRHDKQFSEMPKIRIKFKGDKIKVYDKKTLLDKSTVGVTHDQNQIIIQVPLEVLGNPGKIMTSITSYMGNMPLGWVSWRIIELSK